MHFAMLKKADAKSKFILVYAYDTLKMQNLK